MGDVCEPSSPESCNAPVNADSWLKESSPDETHGADEELIAKNLPGDSMRPVLHFDLTAVPPGAHVVSATAWIRVNSADDSGNPVNVHRVTAAWSEGSVSWNLLASAYDPKVVGSMLPDQGDAWRGVAITSLVRSWTLGTYPNDGVVLIPTSDGVQSGYASKEWSVPSERPCLHVVATCEAP
jgi:hypothetical protein